MIPFLKQLVETIKSEHQDIGKVTIVVPTQRSGVYIKKYLSESADKTTWMPNIISIDDFIVDNCKLNKIDSIELLFLFYEIYLSIEKKEADTFYHFNKWAPTLLADFNEMDHYMVDSKTIFNDLRNIKEIDNWSFGEDNLTEIQQNFSDFWQKLPIYYAQLNDELTKINKGYSGKLYKWVATSIYEVIDDFEEGSVYFAGFNALSTSEQQIIETFVNSGKGQLIVDADTFYVNNPEHEAGYFIRNQIAKNGVDSIKWIDSHLLSSSKKIELLSTQSDVMMVKTAGDILAGLSEEEIKKTAVVLADEQLLLPMINSIPEHIGTYNISVGYSLYNSPIFSLINSVFSIQESYVKYGNGSLHYRGFMKLAEHYLIKNVIKSYRVKQDIVRKNMTFVSSKFIDQYPELDSVKFLFEAWKQENLVENSFEVLNRLIELLVNSLSQELNSLELEYLFAAKKLIQKVENKLTSKDFIQDIKTLRFLFFQLFKSETVSFIGEPISGLQVIGMLETRALDFENLILVSVNEGVLPKGNTRTSFFPYEIKRLYQLPTYKEKEAIYANHFYRLLQRTSNAYLIYNNSSSGISSNEKSRYIEQLKEELKNEENISISEKIVSTSLDSRKIESNQVTKDQVILESIKELAKYGFSPSALRTYIQCPLDFYYSYVVGLKQQDEVEETIEAATLGNVIHKTLEILYLNYVDRVLTVTDIQTIKQKLPSVLDEQFKELYSSYFDAGKNFLLHHAAKTNLIAFLDQEEKLVNNNEVVIVGLEKKMERAFPIEINGNTINAKLKGTIDRIDRVNGELRIIDYKSGVVRPEQLELSNLNDIIENPNKEKAFQLMMYGLIMKENLLNNESFSAGIISFKRLKNGLMKLQFKKGTGANKQTWNPTQDEQEEFKLKLEELIQQIFDTSIQFQHNEKAKYCEYC